MSKHTERRLSPYARDAAILLGQLIRRNRIDCRMTVGELAERAGLSRGLVRRIEQGDPGCSIGGVFEVATIVGLQLFDADQPALAASLATSTALLTLLPKAARVSRKPVKDDF